MSATGGEAADDPESAALIPRWRIPRSPELDNRLHAGNLISRPVAAGKYSAGSEPARCRNVDLLTVVLRGDAPARLIMRARRWK